MLIELGGRDVGDDRATHPDRAAARGVYGNRPAVADIDGIDLLSAFQLDSRRSPSHDQCRGQPPGSARRHREADILGEHRHQEAHHAAARRVDGHVGVHGVAQQQQPGRVPVEHFPGHDRCGQYQQPRQPQCFGASQAVQQLQGCAQRRERCE